MGTVTLIALNEFFHLFSFAQVTVSRPRKPVSFSQLGRPGSASSDSSSRARSATEDNRDRLIEGICDWTGEMWRLGSEKPEYQSDTNLGERLS
jgi:hypothetical protein